MLRRVTPLVAASLMLAVLVGAGQALAATAPNARPSLNALLRQTNAVPRAVLSKAQRRRLRNAARHARSVAKKKPCVAVADLARYRRILAKVKVKRGKRFLKANARLAALGPASVTASKRLLAGSGTKRCGGGVAASTLVEPQMQVTQSDESGMQLHIQMPELHFVPETGGGKSWTRLAMANTDTPGTPGTPGIPVVSNTFGVPDGATLSVDTSNQSSYKITGVNVFPAQPDTVDAGSNDPPPNIFAPPFTSKPFTIDNQAYGTDRFFPSNPATGNLLGTARNLVIGGLQVPAGQYNPGTQTLTVINSLNVTLRFNGGPHTFSEYLGSPWEHSQTSLLSSLLNAAFLRTRFRDIVRTCGEEMLVITNPSTIDPANQFAIARRAAGIRTTVVQTGSAPGQIGTTTAAIQTFIRTELTALGCMHPSYVTIMGDDELVPTFTDVRNGIPSDLPYSLKNDADLLPDVAVGRILGQDVPQLNTEVSKIIGYETTPPSTGDFLRHALVAAQFQDDNADGREERTFIQFAETVRTGLVGRGVTVDRVYKDTPTTTPLKFNDGTDLPASLKKPGFAWNGTGADVTAGWNAGRFLVVHRDHGWSDGWVNPGFTTADAQGLTNGANLPVVLSINCSSAAYDYDETSFTQQSLANANGGAVGVFGDTRDSPTWHNSQLALGFVDALLPTVLPAEGPATKQRMGDALINGKLRLAGLASPATDGNTVNELYLWHYFGDPSMQMWGGDPPRIFTAGDFTAVYRARAPAPGDPPYEVVTTGPRELAGQPISLLRGDQVVGKAIVNGDGSATIPASFGDGSVKVSELHVAIEPDGSPPVSLSVNRTTTTMTQTCPSAPVGNNDPFTVTGTLSPAVAGADVVVTYTRPEQTTFTRTVKSDSNGAWSSTITPQAEATNNTLGLGDWKVHANYSGDDTRTASSTPDCTVTVYDNGT